MHTKRIAFLLLLNMSLCSANYPILSYEEYAKIQHTVPYTLQITKLNQYLFYFGANHSYDPHNEQYPLLEECWKKFLEKTGGKNCIVLVEGRLRNLHGSKNTQEAIRRGGGEGGFITFYAQEKGIPIECPEPNSNLLREELLKQFTKNEVDYRDFAHCVQVFHRQKKINPDLEFGIFYQKYTDVPSLEQMKRVHKTIFNTEFDQNDEPFYYSINNPVDNATIINRVCRQASIIRDQHIVKCIDTHLKEGKNIFIVYGCTHAIMQESAIRKILID